MPEPTHLWLFILKFIANTSRCLLLQDILSKNPLLFITTSTPGTVPHPNWDWILLVSSDHWLYARHCDVCFSFTFWALLTPLGADNIASSFYKCGHRETEVLVLCPKLSPEEWQSRLFSLRTDSGAWTPKCWALLPYLLWVLNHSAQSLQQLLNSTVSLKPAVLISALLFPLESYAPLELFVWPLNIVDFLFVKISRAYYKNSNKVSIYKKEEENHWIPYLPEPLCTTPLGGSIVCINTNHAVGVHAVCTDTRMDRRPSVPRTWRRCHIVPPRFLLSFYLVVGLCL